MTSSGYHSNPLYAIKECSSCGTLYTRDCGCSKRNVEDKILVPKPPKNCARCTRYGYLVDGPNCQGCDLLHQELEKNLVTHSPDFQNTFEPSNASTNVVNAPREPYVVKQDNGSFVDKIIFDLNRAPDSPNQFHCFHCKDVLRNGEACKRCTCAKYGSELVPNFDSILQISTSLGKRPGNGSVFMAQIEKVLSDSEARSSSADEKISEKRIEKANQQSKDFKNQNKDLKDKHDVLKNQATTFEMNNNELNEQLKVLIEKNDDLLAQTKLLKDQLQVKHVVIDTHVECQEKYAKLEAERYKYMIRYSAYFNNDKQHRKQIADQKVLYDKMSVQLVELDKHVRDLKNTVLEKDFKISKLKECSPSQMSHLSNIIEEVPQDPPKRTMITLDGGEFTGPKVVRKITSILKTMFNGSWSTWKEVDKSSRDELWAHFKEGLSDVLVYDAWENSIKKRYPDIKAKVESVKLAKTTGVQFEGADCTILKPYNLEWIKSNHWEDMIDRAAYNGALVEKYGSDPANHPIYDDDLWKQCARDDMKGGVFGWGSIVCGELKEELKEEIKADLKEEMKADLKEEMKNYLKEEMRKELKQETRKELKEEMHAQIQDMLVDYGINSRDTRQTKTKQGNASGCTS
nr:transposase, Ptta/En/Spm [Tanacetum cinerariifolium]